MKKHHAIIVLTLILCAAVACSSRHTVNTLYDIESYIAERPDSALAVLESMDRGLLNTEKLKAYHALLSAMALDKNFVDVSDDSLASIAVGYYSRKGPERYKAMSLYYLGLSYYYSEQYDKAVLEFTKAGNIAEKCDSMYWGLACLAQSHTFSKTHNQIEALKYTQKANKIYKELSMGYYTHVSELNLAKLHYNMEDIETADSLLFGLISSEDVDSKIKASALQSRAFISASRKDADYNTSVNLYETLVKDYGTAYMSYKDYWAYAYALGNLGKDSESYGLISQLTQVDSSTTSYYWQYLIEKHKGRFQDALRFLEKSVTANNEEVIEVLKQSLALSQRDYYESEFENAEYKANNRRLLAISITIAAILIIILTLWGTSVRVKRQMEEKEYYLNYANEILRQLEEARSKDYPDLKKKYLDIYRSKFEMIASLYEQYVLYHGKKNAEHAVYEEVSRLIEDFLGDNSNKDQLESVLNESMDGIVSKLREEMPKLKELDYAIFCYMLIGFDTTTISHLMNISTNSIYIRRSRMKVHIEDSDCRHKDLFINILGGNKITTN